MKKNSTNKGNNTLKENNTVKANNALIIYIIGMFLLPFILSPILVSIIPIDDKTNENIILGGWMNFTIYIIIFIILMVLYRGVILNHFKKFKDNLSENLMNIFIGISLIYFLSFLGTMLLDLLGVTGSSNNQESIEKIFETLPFLISVTPVVFLGPIVEELVFREAMFKFFHKFSDWVILIISSVAFGLIHTLFQGDFAQTIIYILPGIGFGIVYIMAKKNIMVPIFVHILLNLISTILILT